jgi:predicted outer membrane repeat protein
LGFVDIDDLREGNIMISTFSFGRARTFARATRDLIALTATLSFFVSHADAATFIVNRTDDRNLTTANCLESATTPDCAIREALTAASANGGTNAIVISPGLLMTLTIGTPLNVTGSSLTIEGNGATIRRSDFQDTPKFRILDVSVTELAINELTIANGNVDYNTGGIGESGGGIKVKPNVTATLTNTRVIGNLSRGNGAGIFNEGTVKLVGSTVSGNQVSPYGSGGGIFVRTGATLEVTNGSLIAGNIGARAGGGIAVENGTAKVVDSEISSNSALLGGGLSLRSGSSGKVEIVNSTVKGNFASPGTGGGVFQDSGALEISTSTIESNLSNSLIGGVGEGVGGGVAVVASPNLTASTHISDSRIRNNTAALRGGGLFAERTVNVSDSSFSGNRTDLRGGAIYTVSSTSVVNTTLSQNRANRGGAIYAAEFSFLNMTHCTVSRNTTLESESAAVENAGNLLQAARNSIITGNEDDRDVLGAFQSHGNNLIGNVGTATGFSAAIHDIIGIATNPVDAKLRPLGSYGGSAETQPPFSDSPAIDAGNNCVANQSCASGNLSFNLTADQRGSSRVGAVANFFVDIGAVELQTAIVSSRANAGTNTLRSFVENPFPYDRILFSELAFVESNPTITLASPISINRALEITGISPARVAVSGNNAVRPFQIGSNGDVVLKNISITAGNAGAGEGGNIRNAGTLRMENCALSNGVTTANGGGIANVAGAKLFMDRCGFSGNQAGTTGGAIDNAGTMQISNTTFANNSASSGGAIHSINLATNASLLRHITVTGNTASTSGGGIHELANLPSPPLNIQSSIVAGNSSPIAPDVQGAFTSLGHNLIGKFDGANGFTNGVNADIVGSIAAPVAANLQPCGNFGGIITSCPPLPSSRAINNGAPSPHALDQRGLPRAIEGKADIGATDFNLSPAGLLQADGTRLLFAPSGAYSQLLKGFGGDFSFSGIGLPAFLSITPSGTSSSEATLNGTVGPAQAGVYNFSIVGTNTNVQGFTVTNNYKLVAAQSLLNVDNSSPNTIYDAATDGALIVRYLLGMRGPALVSGVLGSGPNLRPASQIESYLADLVELFDVDGDGKTLPTTDGLMILRRMLMPSLSTSNAATITANAKNSARPDADIVNAIDALKP